LQETPAFLLGAVHWPITLWLQTSLAKYFQFTLDVCLHFGCHFVNSYTCTVRQSLSNET